LGFAIMKKRKPAKPRKKPLPQTLVHLKSENAKLRRELSEALEQQTATSEVLRVISSSPAELNHVFKAILQNAIRICEASFGNLFLREGDALRNVAIQGAPAAFVQARSAKPLLKLSKGSNTALNRMAATKSAVQIADIREEPSYRADPQRQRFLQQTGARTVLSAPLLKENELVGAISIYRQEVRLFSDKQVELVTNFAQQAVIAIENARLLNELRQRTDDLSEALEQQTATSEVLSVISSSPGELEPVFRAMLENAVRICEAKFGVLFRYEGGAFSAAAWLGVPPAYEASLRQRGSFRPDARAPLDRLLRTNEPSGQVRWRPIACCCAHAQGERAGRGLRHLSDGGAPVHRKADRAGNEFRSPGRHRHRECAAAE
jgi:regulator of replication initiation timing